MNYNNKKILICDDDKVLLETYSEYFTSKGFISLAAQNGKEALNIIKQEQLNGIILDYNMPYLSGLDVYQQMKNLGLKIPSILVTGQTNADIINEAKSLGINDIFFKPVQIQQLETITKMF